MTSWSELLPRDIREHITLYLTCYDKYFPIIDYKKYFIIYHANIEDTDEDLKYCSKLRELYCYDNINFTDAGLKYLSNLRELYCGSNTNFTDTGLKYLPSLQTLQCGNNINFTNAGLKYLPNLKTLLCGLNTNFTEKSKYELLNPSFYALRRQFALLLLFARTR